MPWQGERHWRISDIKKKFIKIIVSDWSVMDQKDKTV